MQEGAEGDAFTGTDCQRNRHLLLRKETGKGDNCRWQCMGVVGLRQADMTIDDHALAGMGRRVGSQQGVADQQRQRQGQATMT